MNAEVVEVASVLLPPTRQKKRVYLGHSILNGKFRYTSVTQIKMFDPTIEGGCPRKWFFAYMQGKKELKIDAQIEGGDLAEKLEHYLSTGEDILPPVLQEAKKFFPMPGPDLEVEKPLGKDIKRAVELRDAVLNGSTLNLSHQIKELAGLTALDIPLDGAADWRHRRGTYIDKNGVLQKEAPDMRVVSIGDLKSTKQIDSYFTRTKTLMRGYAKTDSEVCDDHQMIGYGQHAVDLYPDITHVRLEHVYAQKKKFASAIRGGLVTVDEIRRRWKRTEKVVRQMEQTTTAMRAEDVQPNTNACDDFVHLVDPVNKIYRQGCAHRLYCPLSQSQQVVNLLGKETSGMSLFDSLQPNGVALPPPIPLAPKAPAPPAPHLTGEDYAAQVELEKAKIKIQSGTLSLDGSGQVFDRTGAEAGGFIMRAPTEAERVAFKTFGAINAPDAPPTPSMFHAAAPMPAEDIAQIGDKDARARAEEHAKAHAEASATEEANAPAPKTKVAWCPGGEQPIALTMEMAVLKKPIPCQCGKLISITKPEKLEDGSFRFVTPKHKVPKVKEEAPVLAIAPPAPPPPSIPLIPHVPPPVSPHAVLPVPPPPPAPPIPQIVLAPSAPMPPAVTPELQQYFDVGDAFRKMEEKKTQLPPIETLVEIALQKVPLALYVDIRTQKGGSSLKSLEEYYAPFLRQMEKDGGVVDVRMAPKSSPLAYGGWKGALSAHCRNKPPASGNYKMESTDEYAVVVLHAISSFCDDIYWG